AWKERLLGAISDACVRHSRRDPRDSAEAEQVLYDQLDGVLHACCERLPIEVLVQSPQWCVNLVLTPLDLTAACRGMLDRSLAIFRGVLEMASSHGPIGAMIATSPAACLPGLVPALEPAA